MSEQITVTLPDGSSGSTRRGTTPAEVAASIGKGLAKAAIAAKVDGEWVDLERPLDRRRPARRSWSPDSDDGREVLRHSTAHVMAEAVTRLFPGAKVAIGPAIADGFYYDFDLPNGADVQRRRSRPHRGRDAARSSRRIRLRALGAHLRRRARRCSPTSRTSRRSSRRCAAGAADAEDAGEAGGDGRACRCTATSSDGRRRVHRPVPRPARPVARGKLGAFKLQKVAGAYWRGNEKGPMLQRIYGTAWESKSRARRAPAPARRSRAARPPQARRRARPVLVPRRDRLRPRGVPPEGRARAAHHGGVLAPAPRGGGLRVRELAAHHQGEPVPDLRAPRLVRRRHVPAAASRRGRQNGEGINYYLKPMNCPFHILIFKQPHALVPRAAAADVRVRHGVPLREVGRRPRPHTRARHDPGRRAHLLHQGADGRGARRRCSTSCSTCCATTASTTSTSSCRRSPRTRRSGTDDGVGRSDRGAARRRVRQGPRARARRGRRRVLRTEDQRAGARTRSAAPGRCRRSSSTSSCRSASTCTTSAPTTNGTAR